MSQQGPMLIVSSDGWPPFVTALDQAQIFPVIETGWADAARAVTQVQPAAVLVAMSSTVEARLAALATQIAARKPYLPLIAVESGSARRESSTLPDNAIPFTQTGDNFDRLLARLRAALRIRALHATVLRRLQDKPAAQTRLPDTDPARDATVLLLGRGTAFPALSVALGERVGVVGAFSIEAAANHLNTRDLDGIVLGEGFTARVVDAFLTVLSEDTRFRNLPIVGTSVELTPTYDLPNLEIVSGEPAHIVSTALPLIRQHAFEAQLSRTLRAIEAGGLLDPQTGLLTKTAFDRDFATAVAQAKSHGGGLSVARFAFDPLHPRAQFDGARIVSRLMRRMDFGTLHDEGSLLVVLAETDLRAAHAVARRLSSVMRHTSHSRRGPRADPTVSVAALQPSDSPASLLARLYADTHRVAS
jgi:hypothetical protein